MSTHWYKLCIVVLIVLNGILLLQNHNLKSAVEHRGGPADPSVYMAQTFLPNVSILDKAGKSVGILDIVKSSTRTMLVFFSPNDCPACFDERHLWSSIQERTGITVYGVASSPDSREFNQWVDVNKIAIDVYLDTLDAIDNIMQFRTTPIKVLVDSRGNVLWADPTREDGPSIDSFWEELKNASRQ